MANAPESPGHFPQRVRLAWAIAEPGPDPDAIIDLTAKTWFTQMTMICQVSPLEHRYGRPVTPQCTV